MNTAAEFLVHTFDNSDVQYSAMGTKRSAISAFLPAVNGLPVGQQPIIKKVMKGIFRLRPAIPRYTDIYDMNKVLDYLKIMGSNDSIEIKGLTHRLATLLCLLSGQRGQTIANIDIEYIAMNDDTCAIMIPVMLKTTKPGRHMKPMKFNIYKEDSTLCVMQNLKKYIELTSETRGNNKLLFLSLSSPYKPVGVATIRRWVTKVLNDAGINIKIYTAHSTRASSTSKAQHKGLAIDEICWAAGWQNCKTFAKHYSKNILEEDNFGDTLLKDNVTHET